jgi:hypothetical protein
VCGASAAAIAPEPPPPPMPEPPAVPVAASGAPVALPQFVRRRPKLIAGVVVAAVAVLVATTVFGGRLPFGAGPGTGTGAGPSASAGPSSSAAIPEPSYPAVVVPPLVKLTPLASTRVAGNGSTATDAKGVAATLVKGSLVKATAVHLVASDMPAAFDSSLTSEDGWRRASAAYSVEVDKGSDVVGTVKLSFPASSPDDRVAVLMDGRYLLVLGVEPAKGRLTVQATTASSTAPAFEGEGDHYFMVKKAGAASVQNSLAMARVGAAAALMQTETGGGAEAATAGGATCSYSRFPPSTTCWNAASSISFTTASKLDSDWEARVGQFLGRVGTIVAKYKSLGFVKANPTSSDPIHIVIDSDSDADPRYSPNLYTCVKIYVSFGTVSMIDDPAQQQLMAHELFHWVQHHTYPMRVDGNIDTKYWHEETQAEAASFLVDPSYQAARLLKVASQLQSNGTQGVLGWQKAGGEWDHNSIGVPQSDPSRYVQGQVVSLGLCDGASCIESQKDLVDEVNSGGSKYSAISYHWGLDNTARYLLGTAPTAVKVELTAPILKTGRGIGDYIHLNQKPGKNSDYAVISNTTNLKKDAASGEVAIKAAIASNGLYPLRVSNGSDVPLDDNCLPGSNQFRDQELEPNAPYTLHLNAGVELYWRVGSGPLQHSDGSQAQDIGPITSEASVAVRGSDGKWTNESGDPSVRIVALNPTSDPVTLTGSVVPLAPKTEASPESVAKLDPVAQVDLRVALAQVALNFKGASADWDFGDGSPIEPTTITPDIKMTATVSTRHVFKTASKGVRVTFRDNAGKLLGWDPVVIPVAGSSVAPGNFNRMVLYMPLGGTSVRKTNLDVTIRMTGKNTFTLAGTEPGIVSLTGTISDDGNSVSLTIVHTSDTENPACADQTILTDLPALKSSGPDQHALAFGVGGWANVMAVLKDTYPWTGRDNAHGGKPIAICTTNKQWSHDEANTGAQVVVTLYY